MSVIIDCPSCQRKLRVPDDLLGRSVKCPTCTTTFMAGEAPAAPPAAAAAEAAPIPFAPPPESEGIVSSPGGSPAPTQARCPSCGEAVSPEATRCGHCGKTLTEEEPFERRRARRDAEPHRGVMVLVLGILSVALAVVGTILGIVVGPCAILTIIALPLGIIAWIFGQRDLRKIKLNQMDPEGEGLTRAGWICGIVGTSLSGLAGVCCLALIVIYAGVMASFVAGAKPAPVLPAAPNPPPPPPRIP